MPRLLNLSATFSCIRYIIVASIKTNGSQNPTLCSYSKCHMLRNLQTVSEEWWVIVCHSLLINQTEQWVTVLITSCRTVILN